MSEAHATDPRPRCVDGPTGTAVVGLTCRSCGHPAAYPWPRCPACGGPVEQALFGPGGTVWAATVVRITVPGRTPPYCLAYVDLDDGPRVLVHVPGATEPPPLGATTRLIPPSPDGDLQVEVSG